MHRTFSLIVWLQIYEINTYSQPLLTCFWKWIIDVLHKNDTNCFKCIKIYYLFYYQTADWCKIMKNCQQLIWQRSQLIRQRKLDCHGNWQDQHNIFLTKKNIYWTTNRKLVGRNIFSPCQCELYFACSLLTKTAKIG